MGDSLVGKTSILNQFVYNEFVNIYTPTIVADFKIKDMELGGKPIKLQVWDTPGQKRDRSLRSDSDFYSDADGYAFAYDITDRKTFKNILLWKGILDQAGISPEGVKMILIGNKSDLADTALDVVSTEEGEAFAREHGMMFIETSAKTPENVQMCFTDLASDIVKRVQPTGGRDGDGEGAGDGSNNLCKTLSNLFC